MGFFKFNNNNDKNNNKAQAMAIATPVDEEKASTETTPASTPADHTPETGSLNNMPTADTDDEVNVDNVPTEEVFEELPVTWVAIFVGSVASIGGFVFGYESGQISGILVMRDFLDRFGENGVFSAARQGTIVSLLCIGSLVGCLFSGWLCDKIGRKYTIASASFFNIIGVAIEFFSQTSWVLFAMGRLIAGLGMGVLSTSVPMYQSESVPKTIRGATVSSYQLFITLGFWTAYMVNYGTEGFDESYQWRIPTALSAFLAFIFGFAILAMPESPRFSQGIGHEFEARLTVARISCVDPYSALIDHEMAKIEEKRQAERAGGNHPLSEIFTGPRMLYRTLLGMTLQAGQQLTGANFFFYHGTTIFRSTGIRNSYITSIILGSVNVAATIAGFWVVKNCGRRKSLMAGAAAMFVCLIVYAFVGHFGLDAANPMSTPAEGQVLIIFTCLFIVAFATTWGPLVWTVVGELYPAPHRAPCMALATASNWLFNFLTTYFTPFITDKIDYFYGLVFGVCCFFLFWIVYFFMIESKDRSLEEIDTMYVQHVNPITSASWEPAEVNQVVLAGVRREGQYFKTAGWGVPGKKHRGLGMLVKDPTPFTGPPPRPLDLPFVPPPVQTELLGSTKWLNRQMFGPGHGSLY